MRTRLLLITALFALAALTPLTGVQAAGFRARLSAPNHNPLANKLWYIKVSATTASGKPLRATATYQFAFNGQVVATRYPSPASPCDETGGKHPYAFKGSYRDGLLFPARSTGIPLTLRVVVKVKGMGVKTLNWKVVVRKSRYSHCTR